MATTTTKAQPKHGLQTFSKATQRRLKRIRKQHEIKANRPHNETRYSTDNKVPTGFSTKVKGKEKIQRNSTPPKGL